MAEPDREFAQRVYTLVAEIPAGRLMTYGQIAALCGSPRAARIVGGIAHYGPLDLPWQRVVKKDGSLAEGYPGGIEGHRQALLEEGIETDDQLRVPIARLQWRP